MVFRHYDSIIKSFINASVLFLIGSLFAVEEVVAYYCEFDSCIEGQYCCGENICCNNSFYNHWYFWVCVVLVLLLISGGVFLFRTFWVKHPLASKYEEMDDEEVVNYSKFDSNGISVLDIKEKTSTVNSEKSYLRNNNYGSPAKN